MIRFLCPWFCLAVFVATGCAPKWAMDAGPSEARLVWPQAPGKTNIRYLTTITGFRERGVSLRMLVFGKGEDRLVNPVAVATGVDGRIAVADIGTKSVHLFIPKEERYIRVFRFDSGEMVSPVSVAFDDELRLYVSDSFHEKVSVFDRGGKYLFSIDRTRGAVLKKPTGLAYDHGRKAVFVVDTSSHRIHAFTTKGEPLFSFGERGSGNGQFNFPTHIFGAADGRIYVTDAMNFRIQIFDPSGGFVTAFGRHGDGSGDFSMPKGVASDSEGTVFVVDTLFDNIQLFNEKGEFLLTLGSRGTGPGEFWLPSGIFIDGGDRLYVCDTYNQRIQIFEIMKGGR
jgi:DNA-binding beta-propeller fold protein YncE